VVTRFLGIGTSTICFIRRRLLNPLKDPDLIINEKRAILASWASDACAVEAAPDLRAAPSGRIVRFDEIMEALRALDKEANGATYRRVLRGRRILDRGCRDTSAGGTALQ
jgi:hypothetical protein